MHAAFDRLARWVSHALGSPTAFVLAVLTVVVWLFLGPTYRWSSDWQLYINTGTTIVTFLMVFVIQNAQNRDTLAIQIKLDELLRAVGDARTGLVDIEELSDRELEKLQARFAELRRGYSDVELAEDEQRVETEEGDRHRADAER